MKSWKPSRDVEAVVALGVDDERGRVGVLDVQHGRALAEGVLIGGEVEVVPGLGGLGLLDDCRSAEAERAELPLVEPHFFGGAEGGLGVVHAVVGDDAVEAVGVGEHPVGHEAAVAGAERALAGLVDEGVFGFGVVEALHQVDVGAAAPVAGDLVDELLAVAGGAAAVDADDDVAVGGEEFASSSGRSRRLPRRSAGRRG